jgi:hypothetical protein
MDVFRIALEKIVVPTWLNADCSPWVPLDLIGITHENDDRQSRLTPWAMLALY